MTAAADKLFLTQPAVSQQIRNLEEELGVNLLERGVRKVKATLQGQLLFDYAKKILHMTQQAEVAIHTMSQEISGDLRIGTLNSFGLYLISPIVGLFLKHNTQLNIKLVYGSTEEVVQKMREGEIDMAILPDVEDEIQVKLEEFESSFLLKDEMWLVGSGRDVNLPKTVVFKEFNTKPIVYYSHMYPKFLRLLEQKVLQSELRFVPVFEADNVGTLKRVIESGLGWGFLPAHCIRKQVRTGRLNHIVIEDINYSVNVNMYFRKVNDIRQKADVFYRALYHQALG